MKECLTQSATTLAARLRAGALTSVDLVDTHIARIRTVNPRLNAVVAERFEAAREEARMADRRLALGEAQPPPLLGVPCTVKECLALEGMPWTAGHLARAGVRAPTDAPVVARLRAAGAIPLGVTNLSELCMWMESYNNIYGRTNNPYSTRRSAGGSSGGEGAIIGAGGSPFGVGSDIGGSIRMPAFFNGVFGHKPSAGLVPNSGAHPLPRAGALHCMSTGPLTRRAEDLGLLTRILAGPDPDDPTSRPLPLGDPATVDLQGLRVIDVRGNGSQAISRVMLDNQQRVAGVLKKLGAHVEEREFKDLKDSFSIWSATLNLAGEIPFGQLLGGGKAPNALSAGLRWMLRLSPHTLMSLIIAFLERLPKDAQRLTRLQATGRRLREELTTAIGDHGVMLFPPYGRPAPLHYTPMATPFSWIHAGIFNVLGFPVTQVPTGLSPRGLPLGVQVAAPHGKDHLTIAVAVALEREFGGWVPPGY